MRYARLRFYSIPSSSQGYRTDDEVWVVLWHYSASVWLGAVPSLRNRTAAKHIHSEDRSRVVRACGGLLSCCPERLIYKPVDTHDYVRLMTGPKSPPIAWATGWVCKNPVTRRSHKWRPKAGRNLVVDRSDSLEETHRNYLCEIRSSPWSSVHRIVFVQCAMQLMFSTSVPYRSLFRLIDLHTA